MTQSSAPDTGFLFIVEVVEISGKAIVFPQLETLGELSLPHAMLGVVFLVGLAKRPPRTLMDVALGCVRLSVVTSLIPTH